LHTAGLAIPPSAIRADFVELGRNPPEAAATPDPGSERGRQAIAHDRIAEIRAVAEGILEQTAAAD